MVVGFEQVSYSVTEPVSAFTTLQVCMVISGGSISSDLNLVVEWLAASATGMLHVLS